VAPNLPAGLVTLVLALSPRLTFLLAVAACLQAFRWLGLAGVVLGFAGILVLVVPSSGALPSAEALGWFALCLIAPCLFATANVSAAIFQPPSVNSVALAAGILLGARPVCCRWRSPQGSSPGYPVRSARPRLRQPCRS
jgi:drug/metabolite transporter (DMT)-like permease